MRSINLLFLFGIRRNCLRRGRSRSWCLSIRRAIKHYGNYRGISLLPSTYKILSNILLSRLTSYAEEIIGDHQCGFRHNRSTTDHLFCVCQILEKNLDYNKAVHQPFWTSIKLMIQLGGRSCIIFSLGVVSP